MINKCKVLLIAALTLLTMCAHTQPIIALGSTKGFIRHNMAKDSLFNLAATTPNSLQYINTDNDISVMYRFISRRCNDILVSFPDSTQLSSYIERKMSACKLAYVTDTQHQLITDLFDAAICFETINNRQLLIRYCYE